MGLQLCTAAVCCDDWVYSCAQRQFVVTIGSTAVHSDRMVHNGRPKISAQAAVQILFFQQSSYFAHIKRLGIKLLLIVSNISEVKINVAINYNLILTTPIAVSERQNVNSKSALFFCLYCHFVTNSCTINYH